MLIRKFRKRTKYVPEVFSTEQHEIRIDNAVYCVQRCYQGEREIAEIIAKKILESPKTGIKIDVYAPISYNIDGKLVQGG